MPSRQEYPKRLVRNGQQLLLVGTAWYCVLPSGRGPIRLCHQADPDCRRCMSAIARFLAAEMQHDFTAAIERSAYWYMSQIVDHSFCSVEQARDLRRLTALACLRDVPADLMLADDISEPLVVPARPYFRPENPLARLWHRFTARFTRGASQLNEFQR